MFANSHFALGTHVVTALAVRGDGPPVTSTDLAQSVNTNPSFLRTLLGQLRRAGLIEVALGKGGGARLARPASRLTLADVYRAVERRPPVIGWPGPRSRTWRLGSGAGAEACSPRTVHGFLQI